MSVLRRLPILALPLFVAACNADDTNQEQVKATAAPVATQASEFNKEELIERFSKLRLNVEDVIPSEIEGLVEVQTSGGPLYASPDGKFFIAGTLFSLADDGQYVDVVAKRQAPLNVEKLAKLQDSMIEFKAENEKYVVTVFTDITCGYCVRLHSEMKEYNDLGITIRYLAFPRQGGVSPVADQMAAIWCSSEPKSAMHDAKINRVMPEKGENFAQCQSTIKQHYQLGKELGISGTPAIFLPNGEMVGGYLPPEKLLERLQSIQ
ncbi:bifunctional protein-disulfide isomerase/oxidoreductase DsbC [Vibrio sp. NTOU-M3]|uniref:bifunctional protein-disulfide isomerase/oxidoreductase DsbC n=1 Tax=Vibrio sp. NTOU-M3 TaxID=3234954 RepID=UPI00349F4737